MRTLAITQDIALDSSVEMLGDRFGAQGEGAIADLLEENHRQDAGADAFDCGRETFLSLPDCWRDLADDTTGVSDYLNAVHKYVASIMLTDPKWDPTAVLDGDPVAAVRELKQQQARDTVLTGGIRLGRTLIQAGLVDAYRLFIYPVVQRWRRRSFSEVPRLELVRMASFTSGVALLVHRVPLGDSSDGARS